MDMDSGKSFQDIRHSLHDLAQPLAAVTGLVDLLLLEADAGHPWFQELVTISQQLEKVLDIVGEIRRIARDGAEDLMSPSTPAH
jgi:signal transduction histidine kinase